MDTPSDHLSVTQRGTRGYARTPTVTTLQPAVKRYYESEKQLELALDYAPQDLRDHGLRDAHAYPLVSPDVGKVRHSFRQPASVAWTFPRVEMRAGNSFPAITLDCDGAESVGKLAEFILDEDLPTPNVIVRRVASGNCHAHYMLAAPVHRGDGARLKPLQSLARVSEYLSTTLRADRGYNGVLTLNPAWPGPEYETSYLRAWPWELRELGEIIPDGWRCPPVPATAIGRNVALFQWAVKEAHRPRAAEVIRFHGSKDCPYWEQIVLAKYEATYGPLDATFPVSEVRSIARSSARYSLRQYDRAKFIETRRQRGKAGGKASGAKRRAGSIEGAAPWKAQGVSRATWYRRRRRETGSINR